MAAGLEVIAFAAALGLSLLLVPAARRLSFAVGKVAAPRADRWHSRPTPLLGGVGIFSAFLLATAGVIWVQGLFPAAAATAAGLGFLAGSGVMFVAGLYDDFRPMTPSAKLVSQILAATLVIGLGFTSSFFSGRVPNAWIAQVLNICLTYVWLVGITNAINLLDNMDGLAGGIGLITAGVLAYFFGRSGDAVLMIAALTLAGSLTGFLVFNFPPARIFMGDSGSQFLGFTLAVMAIAHQKQQASNVLAVVAVPTLLFLLPILDTALVTVTRMLRGQSPAQGGRDHTSHRLVAFGLSERQALGVMYGVALVSAVVAAAVESLNYWLSLALVPLLIILLAAPAAYLARVRVVEGAGEQSAQTSPAWVRDLAYRRRIPEVLLDFALISLSYYLAFLAYFQLTLDAARMDLFLQTLPYALAAGYLALFAAGVYRGLWRYAGFEDGLRYLQAVAGAGILLAGLLFVFSAGDPGTWETGFPPAIPILFGMLLFIGLAATRLSFRLLDRMARSRPRPGDRPVVLCGAGDAAELALRWMQANPGLGYRPIGIVDADPFITGRWIHGVRVIGGAERLAELLEAGRAEGVILTGDRANAAAFEVEIDRICRHYGCWVRRLRMGLEAPESTEIVPNQ